MMSERIDKFCQNLQTRLNDLESRALALKASVRSAPQQAEEALHKQMEQLQKKIDSQKKAASKARTEIESWLDQKKAESKATVEQWKAKHEAKKLAHRADRAEEYAMAAFVVALASVDEAEHALLEAIAARIDADAMPVG
jgi:membrane protein involved in colicin uptake